jgi:hypothetical protein
MTNKNVTLCVIACLLCMGFYPNMSEHFKIHAKFHLGPSVKKALIKLTELIHGNICIT